MGKLDGRVVVITGSTRGLGLAIARAYVREGASAVVSSRSAEAVERAVASLAGGDGRVTGRACDTTDLAQVEALAAHALNTYGRFDVWVNNAGISPAFGPTMDVPPEEFVRTVQTNIVGTYNGALVALRYFLPRRTGKLINLLGRGDRQPVPMQNAYSASKAWVRNFTLALAKEYADSGVGIFAFSPGMVLTDLLTHVEVIWGYESRLKAMPTVLRMWAHPAEVPAEKAVWLASAATDGKTGIELRLLGMPRLVLGMLREGWRRLTRQPEPPTDLRIVSVPGALSSLNAGTALR